MEHLIKLFLDQPDRLERLAINSIRFLITVWTLSLLIVGVTNYMRLEEELSLPTELGDLTEITAYNLSLYIILFILAWLILWEFLASLIIPVLIRFLGYMFGKILSNSILLLAYIVAILIYPFRSNAPFPKFPEDMKFWKRLKTKETEFDTEYYNKHDELNRTLRSFSDVDKLFDSALGSKILLQILQYEKMKFINSRIQQYYAAVIFVLVGFSLHYKVSDYQVYYYSVLIFFFLIGLLVIYFDSIFWSIHQINQYALIDDLKLYIYSDMIKEAIEEHPFLHLYDIQRTRKRIVLKYSKKLSKDVWRPIFIGITAVTYQSISERISRIIERKQVEEEESSSYSLIVSNKIPTVEEINRMTKNNIGFIFAENDEDVLRGIEKLKDQLFKYVGEPKGC